MFVRLFILANMEEQSTQKKIVIAIDGHSSCGKSTLAKALAKTLDYVYVDSGAMYRAVALYFKRQQIDLNSEQQVSEALKNISISFSIIEGINTSFLNGENVENEIRSLDISNMVSEVAAISAVRKKLVEEQQKLGKDKGIVMDGRDIGSVVFPNAELKLFVTADVKIRGIRRYEELLEKGFSVSLEEILDNLKKRDFIDSNRADSPLLQAKDAVLLDNSHMTRDEQLNKVHDWALAKISLG